MLNYLRKWMDQLRWQRLKPFEKPAVMLLNHLDGIMNYCRTKVRFGVVEAAQSRKKKERTDMKLIAGSTILLALVIGSAWADAADGKAVFESKCRACHGADGKGNPAMVKAMGVKPIGGTAEADTKAAVIKGKNKMKPITSVTGKQLDDVAAYVASLK